MDKKKLNIILRGYIYKENWRPLSARRYRLKKRTYNINLIEHIEGYKNLIKILEEKYDIKTYITTYDTTPINILEEIRQKIQVEEFILSEEKNSHQFTTVIKIFKEIKFNENDLILLIRPDLVIKQKLADLILDHEFNQDLLYILKKERNPQKVIDVLHIFYGSKAQHILDYFLKLTGRVKDAHFIHKKIKANFLLEENCQDCLNTYLCKSFYEVVGGGEMKK